MVEADAEVEGLIEQARRGDGAACQELLARHRARLRQMVAVRMDARLAARLDPSDVVQESLAEADRRLDAYLGARPLPFYPWLRQLAWDRLVEQHRRHLRARRRSVTREEEPAVELPDSSALALADRLLAREAGPSEALHSYLMEVLVNGKDFMPRRLNGLRRPRRPPATPWLPVGLPR